MKEIRIQIPQQQEKLIVKLVEQLGGNVIAEKPPTFAGMKRNETDEENSEAVPPTFLFGKWADLELDAKKIREEAWHRNQKF